MICPPLRAPGNPRLTVPARPKSAAGALYVYGSKWQAPGEGVKSVRPQRGTASGLPKSTRGPLVLKLLPLPLLLLVLFLPLLPASKPPPLPLLLLPPYSEPEVPKLPQWSRSKKELKNVAAFRTPEGALLWPSTL